jgi:hypothetical protein
MGNSTTTVLNVLDIAASKGIADPRQNAAGYGTQLALRIANDTMGSIIAERFNWKWNRANAVPLYTNSFQQDYPQIGLTNVGWLEDCDRVDINNTALPKPLRQLTVRRQLSRCGMGWAPVSEICWMYNNQLSYGVWPGAYVVYHPLVAALIVQNPAMSMIDANGNLLIVTGFGTTGTVAPVLAANSAEGTTFVDGSVTWTVVGPMSQGFRVVPLPGAIGPVWQLLPYYQKMAPAITALANLINPIPDDYSRFYQAGFEAYCLQASPNPGDRNRFKDSYSLWMKSMDDIRKQGDREADAYAMLPATSPVENTFGWMRNPQDPGQPY